MTNFKGFLIDPRHFVPVLFVCLMISCSGEKTSVEGLGTVVRADLLQKVTVGGTLIPNRKTVISAPYNGYVRKLFVHIGDRVNAGDAIVSVAQSLKGSTEEVYPLRAPLSGMVVQVLKTEGEYVEQGGSSGANPLVRIDDLSRLFIDAAVPEIDIEKLKVGQLAVIKLSAILGKTYQARIESISLAAKEQKEWDKSRVEFSSQLRILNADDQLKPGMSVIADIITNKIHKVLTLRHEFLQKSGESYFVITEKGVKKNVEVGIQNEEAFEIKKGVEEGEKIRQTDFLSLSSGT